MGSVTWRIIRVHGWWPWSAIGRRSGSSRSSSCAIGPRIHPRRGSMLVLTVLTPRDVARNGRTRQVITPTVRLFPTTLPDPRARGSIWCRATGADGKGS